MFFRWNQFQWYFRKYMLGLQVPENQIYMCPRYTPWIEKDIFKNMTQVYVDRSIGRAQKERVQIRSVVLHSTKHELWNQSYTTKFIFINSMTSNRVRYTDKHRNSQLTLQQKIFLNVNIFLSWFYWIGMGIIF